MRNFCTPVDKRSKQAMVDFLKDHFRYPTMNSWNNATSYACNMKIYNLGLDRDVQDKIYQMLDVDEFHDQMGDLLRDFGYDHGYLWQAGMNGRGGGYLVLYQGCREPSGYKSYCVRCGQQNYTSVTETGDRCGRCGQNSRRDYPQTHMRISAYPGRGTDMCEDFEDWYIDDLRERVTLVQAFDQLADHMVEEAAYMAQYRQVQEETFMVPQTRLVFA